MCTWRRSRICGWCGTIIIIVNIIIIIIIIVVVCTQTVDVLLMNFFSVFYRGRKEAAARKHS